MSNSSKKETQSLTDGYESIKSQRRTKKIAYIIVEDMLVNAMTKKEICKKYRIASNTFDSAIELLKEENRIIYDKISEKIINDEKEYLFHAIKLIEKISYYIKNGIQIGENKQQFTMLDYHCLTDINPNELAIYIRALNMESKENFDNKNKVIYFIEKNKNVGPFVNAEAIVNQKIAFTIKGKRVEITEDISNEILKLFTENGIPNNYNMVYTALKRYARGLPILPMQEIYYQQREIVEKDNYESGKSSKKL